MIKLPFCLMINEHIHYKWEVSCFQQVLKPMTLFIKMRYYIFYDALLMLNVVLFSLVSLNVYFVYYSLLKNLSFSFSVIATFTAILVEKLNSREWSFSLSTSRQTIMWSTLKSFKVSSFQSSSFSYIVSVMSSLVT